MKGSHENLKEIEKLIRFIEDRVIESTDRSEANSYIAVNTALKSLWKYEQASLATREHFNKFPERHNPAFTNEAYDDGWSNGYSKGFQTALEQFENSQDFSYETSKQYYEEELRQRQDKENDN